MSHVFERLLRMTTQLETVVTHSSKLSPRTRELYLAGIREFLTFAGPEPKNWTSAQVEKWRDRLLKGGQQPQTINIKLNGLRYASRRIAEKGKNPALDFAAYAKMLKPSPPKKRKPLTVAQARALVAACDGERAIDIRDKAIAILGLRTGLRRAAMCELSLSDLRGNKLHAVMKGGTDLTIYLDEETLTILHVWIKLLKSMGARSGALFRAMARPQLDGTVTLRDEHLSTDGLYRAMKARAKKAGIKGFHPHIFRHTFISLAVAAGVPNWRIREMTGQKSDSIIEQYSMLQGSDEEVGVSHLPSFGAAAPEEVPVPVTPPVPEAEIAPPGDAAGSERDGA